MPWKWCPTNRIQKSLWERYYQHSHKITNNTLWPGSYTNITSQRHLEIDCTITPGNYQQINHIWSIPTRFQEALLNPPIKKMILDHLNKNYCPVSNLSFGSKLVEWVVADQLVSYLDTYNLMEPNQSAYRTKHSTGTTLLSHIWYPMHHG